MSGKDPKTGRDALGRFEKGESPNPKGRPAKVPAPPQSSLGVIFNRKVKVKAPDGTMRELSAKEALDQTTVRDALKGKAGAINRAVKMLIKRDKWIRADSERKAQRAKKYAGDTHSWVDSFVDPENANDALQILGIATRDDEYDPGSDTVWLKLEHWAVEMALSRRRSSVPLSDQNIVSINFSTRDPESLTWPKGSRV